MPGYCADNADSNVKRSVAVRRGQRAVRRGQRGRWFRQAECRELEIWEISGLRHRPHSSLRPILSEAFGPIQSSKGQIMTSATENTTIHSSMADDPDFGELVGMYVDEMPDRITVLEQALASGNMELLRRTAHQMKGAAGSYGFDQLTPYAAAVEAEALDGEPEEKLQKTVQELLDVCRLVRAGNPT